MYKIYEESSIAGFPSVDEQHREAADWAAYLWQAGYPTELHGSGFDREWRVFGPGWNGPQVATILIDGCGASWKGPGELWTKIIAPHVDMI